MVIDFSLVYLVLVSLPSCIHHYELRLILAMTNEEEKLLNKTKVARSKDSWAEAVCEESTEIKNALKKYLFQQDKTTFVNSFQVS